MVKPAVPLASAPRLGAAELDRLDRLRRLGYLLDNSIPIPGTRYRIGLEAIIGLVPGLGDLVGGGFSAWIILQAARLGAPPSLVARMGWNLLVDAVVGGAVVARGRRPRSAAACTGPSAAAGDGCLAAHPGRVT